MTAGLKFGADRLADEPGLLPPGRWGLLTNNAARSCLHPEHHSRIDLLEAGIEIVRLFSPEHGIDTTGADGKPIPDQGDPVTGLPITSLYGSAFRPRPESLAELDGLLVDLPDAGVRFYTYLWSMSHLMEAGRDAQLPLVVLDRPNPLGGRMADVEGPLLNTGGCCSFLGRAPMPVRHSLTPGESARWLTSVLDLQELTLHVIPMNGWTRSKQWPDTGCPFVPPSPGLPAFESLLCYPGTCFFEATNLSLGRGTDQPFRQIGAPWLDPEPLLDRLDGLNRLLPGVRFRTATFTPSLPPCEGSACRGVEITVTDRHLFRPVRTGLTILSLVTSLCPGQFKWAPYPTAANPDGERHFERLIGRQGLEKQLTGDPDRWIESLPKRLHVGEWDESTHPYRIYK